MGLNIAHLIEVLLLPDDVRVSGSEDLDFLLKLFLFLSEEDVGDHMLEVLLGADFLETGVDFGDYF